MCFHLSAMIVEYDDNRSTTKLQPEYVHRDGHQLQYVDRYDHHVEQYDDFVRHLYEQGVYDNVAGEFRE